MCAHQWSEPGQRALDEPNPALGRCARGLFAWAPAPAPAPVVRVGLDPIPLVAPETAPLGVSDEGAASLAPVAVVALSPSPWPAGASFVGGLCVAGLADG